MKNQITNNVKQQIMKGKKIDLSNGPEIARNNEK
jgi:hypothetical protein